MRQADYNKLFINALKASILAEQESYIVEDDELSEADQQEMLVDVAKEVNSLANLNSCIAYIEHELGAEDGTEVAEYLQIVSFELAVAQGWITEE